MDQPKFRVELSSLSDTLTPGLQARVGDPLWLLARQWQVGELHGEDAGTPVRARYRVQRRAVTQLAAVDGEAAVIEDKLPLEPQVEAVEGAVGFGEAAELGAALIALLKRHGAPTEPARAAWPLPPPDAEGLSPRTARRVRLLARRSLDGAAAARASLDEALQRIAPPDPAALRPHLEAWQRSARARVYLPAGRPELWSPERMEHAFELRAEARAGDLTQLSLRAEEYPGGRLEWCDVDLLHEAPPTDAPRAAPEALVEVIPSRVRFRGMPAERFWEIEDGGVYFGAVEAEPSDLARQILAEFALVHGDDWWMFPVPLEAGSLSRLSEVEVVDSFGVSTSIRSLAEADREIFGEGGRSWRFFELSEAGAEPSGAPWLYLPRALASQQEGSPREELLLLRDEAANLAWAVEQVVEGPLGERVDRRAAWLSSLDPEAPPEAPPPEGTWRYRLQSTMPPHWFPLVPVRPDPSSEQVVLRRGRVALHDVQTPPPQGELIAGPVRTLREEEVPRAGVRVARSWQLTRDEDGRVVLWRGRRKALGARPEASGLSFDTLER